MAKTSKIPVISGTKKHKIMSVLALAGLYVCGLLTGLGINSDYAEIQKNTEKELSACERIESQLLKEIISEPRNADEYFKNINTYDNLLQYGCEENRFKYRNLIQAERRLVSLLYPNYQPNGEKADIKSCEKTESIILNYINADNEEYPNVQDYIDDAESIQI